MLAVLSLEKTVAFIVFLCCPTIPRAGPASSVADGGGTAMVRPAARPVLPIAERTPLHDLQARFPMVEPTALQNLLSRFPTAPEGVVVNALMKHDNQGGEVAHELIRSGHADTFKVGPQGVVQAVPVAPQAIVMAVEA